MFSFLSKKLGYLFAKKQTVENGGKAKEKEEKLSTKLSENIEIIKDEMRGSSDVIIREIFVHCNRPIEAALVFVDGLVNASIVNDNIIYPLMHNAKGDTGKAKDDVDLMQYIKKALISVTQATELSDINGAIDGFLSGDVVLLVNGEDKALILSTKGWEKRSVSEPASEAVIRGPRESFTENMRTNTSLIRRKIRNPALTFESMIIGEKTRTNVCIVYIKGVADSSLIETIRKRLSAIDTDSILESGYIEQYIEDSPGSIFATIGYTEKPDVAAAKMLEGRAAIIVDGTPIVLTAPLFFVENFQTAEDYYFRPYFSNFLRVIRLISYLITTLTAGLYVAVTTYHQELLPTSLLLTMASAREGIPFPAFIETVIMAITFEILREAGIRLPRPIGQALSIVGALVIGESAVSAGIIGAPMVIVVAITAITSFIVPNEADSVVVLRFIIIILGANLGVFGIIMGMLGVLVHMSSLESFGYPFLYPIVPYDPEDSKDAILRVPLWMMVRRPKPIAKDKQRKVVSIPPVGERSHKNEGNLP